MIKILSPDVVDRIAAGEVLDRPSNLVKELVENSLDAGATQIDIEFDGGGRQVVINDDGRGMAPEDLALALKRHATSKIQNSEDLFDLHSFGFRGEALASIAAVSRLSLTSRARGQETAYRILSEYGSVSEPIAMSAAEGTELRVTDLFANVPARLKFLKSDAAEHTQIKNALKALAFANESVGFSVRNRGELLFHWPKGQTFAERAASILESIPLYSGKAELQGFHAEVLVSSPQTTVNLNRNMWFFVQGRWIQDRSLSASVMEAYRNLLMHGEYPTVIVRLTVPPDEVDVNVHPTKSQVKFRDGQLAFRVCHRAIREVLEKSPWLETPKSSISETFELKVEEAPQVTMSFGGQDFRRTQYQTKSFPLSQVREAVTAYQPMSSPASTPVGAFAWSSLHVVGQLNHTYIVAQTEEYFYLVDQHAAHERVVFEKLMAAFKDGKIEVQNLLLPLTLDFSAPEVEALVGFQTEIEKMGLSLERMGPESVAVTAIPTMVQEGAVSVALHRLAHEISNFEGERAFEKMVGDIFASMACHSVVRAGQSLSVEEMRSLLTQMDLYPLSSFCPHGRPVFVRRRFSEVEREFGRLV